MIKAVLFDFDETLQDRTEAFENYMDAFLDCFCPSISYEEKEIRKQDMRVTGKGGYVDREKWYAMLVEKWHWTDAPSPSVLANHYDTNFGDFNVVFPNSPVLLKELKQKGYTTGVITNGPSILQNHKMDTSGLRQYCDIVVVSGDVGVHKPDPALFIYTAEKLGLKAEECVYVGDHPINDIKGALDAGMKAIRMNFGWFKNQNLTDGVPVIEDIIDVLKYV
ncbi:MAG: HAD-IA family hydrolase [Acetobacter sp.]|nr:HAD-IA family hydrolase [Bacteroides sp.]MCM1340449.1 HAD-IA family hydrolase [Acetobacter sp.]MCM1432904.1 HAD-IA family hydrolase [Clostridiales bacterium]